MSTPQRTNLGTLLAVGLGSPVRAPQGDHTFTLTVSGSGAVSASVAIMGSNDLLGWVQIASLTAAGTGVGSGAASVTSSYAYWRADASALAAGAAAAVMAATEEGQGAASVVSGAGNVFSAPGRRQYAGLQLESMTARVAGDFSIGGATGTRVMTPCPAAPTLGGSTTWNNGAGQVLQVTTSGSGAGMNVTRTLGAAVAALGAAPVLHQPIFIEDPSQVATLTLRVFVSGDTTNGGYWQATYDCGGVAGNVNRRRAGYHLVNIASDEWTAAAVGSGTAPTDWSGNIVAIRWVILNASGATQSVVYLGDPYVNTGAMPAYVMMLDGVWDSAWSNVSAMARAYGIQLTLCPSYQDFGAANRMTDAQFFAALDQGHQISVRSANGIGTVLTTLPAVLADVSAANAAAAAKFGSRADQRFWAYSQGRYYLSTLGDLTVPLALRDQRGIVSGRTTDTTNGPLHAPQGYGLPDNVLVLPICGEWSAQTASNIVAQVDKAIARKSAMFEFCHDVSQATTIPSSRTMARDAVFAAVADRAAAGRIESKTWAGWYDSLSLAAA